MQQESSHDTIVCLLDTDEGHGSKSAHKSHGMISFINYVGKGSKTVHCDIHNMKGAFTVMFL